MKITLVHNPEAGFQRLPKEKLLESVRGEGIQPYYLSSKDHHFHETLLAHPGDMVLVAGGDGTVREVAYVLSGRHIPLAVVPLGTANNIAHTLGPAIPVGRSNDQWMNLSTRAFDAGTVKFQSQHEKPAFDQPAEEIRYVQSFIKNMLADYPACPCDISIDKRTYTGRFLLVAVMNIKSVGPHLWLTPEADPGDGWFDVVMIREEEKEKLADYLHRLEQVPAAAASFTVERGQQIKIATRGGRFYVDDTLMPVRPASGSCVPLEVTLQKNRLCMFGHSFRLPD